MKPSMFLKVAASGLALTFVATGCSGSRSISSASQPSPEKPAAASRAADKARSLLANGKVEKAVVHAEIAVAQDSRNAAHRSLLGQSYLAAGRFASAITAFGDAQTLGAADAQTVIGLALAQIATGKEREAVELIAAKSNVVPASDAGLALALAGDTRQAIAILIEAARAPDADARTRQNLAFALAMAGKWAQAQIIAAQDLSPDKVEPRMLEWSRLAEQPDGRMRVAGLMGVTPVTDAGMPVRLALSPAAAAPVALALADPAPIAEYAPPPPSDEVVEAVAASLPSPAIRSVELPMPTTPAKAAEAEIILADTKPYRAAPVAAPTRSAAAEARTLAARIGTPAKQRSFDAKKPSGWAVQLGSFDSVAVAKDKWGVLSRANPVLKSYPASSQSANVKGRDFYRLTVNGLTTRAEAVQLCASLRGRGQRCFVRSMSATEKVQWASKPGVRMASR